MDSTSRKTPGKYPFLHSHIEKEAHIYEVLEEIDRQQAHYLKTREGLLATQTSLRQSRAIKIPQTPSRNKNILYLTEQLCKNYPNNVRIIRSFVFNVDQSSKKLSIEETAEYTVNLREDDFNRIQIERDIESGKNLLGLLSQFRLFNLTKLIKSTTNKAHISRLIKEELGSNIFTFKHYTLDKNQFEIAEDYCFHKNNYEAVKNRFNADELRKVISAHSAPIVRRMKKFGILNTEFSDYRDTKLDYLLNIILEELSSSLDKRDLVDVKNFASLRTCLLKVNKVIDPLISIGDDMVRYIRENGLSRDNDLLAIFSGITPEMLSRWSESDLEKKRIVVNRSQNNNLYFIDGAGLVTKMMGMHRTIVVKSDSFEQKPSMERNEYTALMDLLCDTCEKLLQNESRAQAVLGNEGNVHKARQIIKEYEDYKHRTEQETEYHKDYGHEPVSLVKKIINFFSSLFGNKSTLEEESPSGKQNVSGRKKPPLSKQTRDLYSQIKTKSAPVIALSDYLELGPDNEIRVDTIINEIRQNNLKIVIPIYNARTTLYPVRSQDYLMADIDYLMVDPDIITSPESIRSFTDSLAGYKLKDETIPGRGIMAIENYLLTLYRQNRARKLRKKG